MGMLQKTTPERVIKMSTTSPSARAAYERYRFEASAEPCVNLKADNKSGAVMPQSGVLRQCTVSIGSKSAKKIILAYETGLQ